MSAVGTVFCDRCGTLVDAPHLECPNAPTGPMPDKSAVSGAAEHPGSLGWLAAMTRPRTRPSQSPGPPLDADRPSLPRRRAGTHLRKSTPPGASHRTKTTSAPEPEDPGATPGRAP